VSKSDATKLRCYSTINGLGDASMILAFKDDTPGIAIQTPFWFVSFISIGPKRSVKSMA